MKWYALRWFEYEFFSTICMSKDFLEHFWNDDPGAAHIPTNLDKILNKFDDVSITKEDVFLDEYINDELF